MQRPARSATALRRRVYLGITLVFFRYAPDASFRLDADMRPGRELLKATVGE